MNNLKEILNDDEWFCEMKELFNEQFDGSADQLIFQQEANDTVIFKLDDNLIRFQKNEDDAWLKIEKVILNKETIIVDEVTPKLLENSSNEISYVLYPFEQCKETSIQGLGYKDLQQLDTKDISEQIMFDNHTDFFTVAVEASMSVHWNDFTVYIGYNENDQIIYIVAQNNNIISCFLDDPTTYQIGDGDTSFYLDGKDLVIENCGDVSSVVVIKYEKQLT
jgi:hypothetical protein